MTEDVQIIEDDPILGKYLTHYPINRLRLLIFAGALLLVIWFIITIALWQVEEGPASIITVVVLGLATLGIGWYLSHLWNREVVLYERGFSYREGSYTAFIKYEDVLRFRQRGEQLSYFGGLVRRSTLNIRIVTNQDEIITLTNLYRNLDELSLRLEKQIMQQLRPAVELQLADGKRVEFTHDLALDLHGLHTPDRDLPWHELNGYTVENGHLIIASVQDSSWYSIKLGEVDNIRLLVELLKQRRVEK